MQASSSSETTIDPRHAYEALHPEIQRWIREQGWSGLRPVQASATSAIMGGTADVLISAGTAAGKTEAAFLPTLTLTAGQEARGEGLGILYVAPLKALLNDQFGRLEELCDRLEMPLVRWHGDAPQAAKNKLLSNPRGVVLITPESVEALFLRRAADARRMFARTSFIIVDEVHAFLSGIRGTHLASLLRRIDNLAAVPARRIGLSATIGDPVMAAAWLRPSDPGRVRIITGEGGAELQLQVRGYLDAEADGAKANPEAVESSEKTSLTQVVDHLFARLRGTNNLVFGGSRQRVEAVADGLRQRCEKEGVPNEFFPHHGNLSKDLREELEHRLKEGRLPTTAVCTSTLELGIDIGSVTSVAQIGAPRSLSALRQRLGRSGRRKGTPSILRVYVTEREAEADPSLRDEMRVSTVMAVAAIRLLLARFVEPSTPGAGLATALLHQTLSLISERGGARAENIYRTLCGPGPFAAVTQPVFAQLLRGMGSTDTRLIEQAPGGLLMLGEAGERLVASRDFFALFESSEEWRLVSGGRSLGTIPLSNPVAKDNLILFAGRRWVVLEVDDRSRVIEVNPHKGGRLPRFEGTSVEPLHDHLVAEMLSVYRETQVPTWLDPTAAELLRQGRTAFTRHRASAVRVLSAGRDIHLLTWRGTGVNSVLAVALTLLDLRAEAHDLGVTVSPKPRIEIEIGEQADQEPEMTPLVVAALERIASRPLDAITLAGSLKALGGAKFDAYVPAEVLRASWMASNAPWIALLPEVAAGLLAAQEDGGVR